MLRLRKDQLDNIPYTLDLGGLVGFSPVRPGPGLRERLEALIEEYSAEEVLSCFKPADLLAHRSLKWVVDNRIRRGLEVRGDNRRLNYVMGYGILVSLVHDLVVESLARSLDNPLKSLTGIQMHCLMCAWSHSVINEGVFNTRNIVKYGKYGFPDMKAAVNRLQELGFIEAINDNQLYRITKKVRKIHGRKNTTYKYMRITRTGEKLMKYYFDLYTVKHKEFTGEFWNVELDTLEKFKNYEQK